MPYYFPPGRRMAATKHDRSSYQMGSVLSFMDKPQGGICRSKLRIALFYSPHTFYCLPHASTSSSVYHISTRMQHRKSEENPPRMSRSAIDYVELSDRSALPVMLIHGMSFDHEMWLPQIELLSGMWESRIPCLLHPLPGACTRRSPNRSCASVPRRAACLTLKIPPNSTNISWNF